MHAQMQKILSGWGVLTRLGFSGFFLVIVFFTVESRSNWTQGVSVPVFLRKPIGTCDFPGDGGGPPQVKTPPMQTPECLNVLCRIS